MAFDYSSTVSPCSIKGASQIELEMIYSKHQLNKAIEAEFKEAGFEAQIESCEIPVQFGLDLLVQLVLRKRSDVATLVGILRHHFDTLDHESPAQACADMLLKSCEQDLCDWDNLSGQVVIRYDISSDVQARIDRYQYPLPMIEEPRPVTHNRQTGYRTIKRSIILKNNHHEDDVCLDHINRLNQQKLSLNPDVVAFVRNSWRNLDKKKEGETDDEFEARKRAFERYDEVSRDVIDALLFEGDGFWLTHAYDKRGRTYAQGYHVNYQGNDWNKAVVQFARAEKLNEE